MEIGRTQTGRAPQAEAALAKARDEAEIAKADAEAALPKARDEAEH